MGLKISEGGESIKSRRNSFEENSERRI